MLMNLISVYLFRAIFIHYNFDSDFCEIVAKWKIANNPTIRLLAILKVVPPEPEFLNEYEWIWMVYLDKVLNNSAI